MKKKFSSIFVVKVVGMKNMHRRLRRKTANCHIIFSNEQGIILIQKLLMVGEISFLRTNQTHSLHTVNRWLQRNYESKSPLRSENLVSFTFCHHKTLSVDTSKNEDLFYLRVQYRMIYSEQRLYFVQAFFINCFISHALLLLQTF